MDLKKELEDYKPYNEQEEKDRELILKHLCSGADVYTRASDRFRLGGDTGSDGGAYGVS